MEPVDEVRLRRAFGKVLRARRLKKGISQEDLARKSDSNRAYIGSLEAGMYTPTLFTMHRLCIALRMRLGTMAREIERSLRHNN